MNWFFFIAIGLVIGIFMPLLLRSSVRWFLLLPLIVGLGAFAAIAVSALVPGGLLNSWPRVAGAGAFSAGFAFLLVAAFGFIEKLDDERVASQPAILGAGGLAFGSFCLLMLIAITGPQLVSLTAYLGMALILFLLASHFKVGRKQRFEDEEKVSGTD